LGIDTARIHDKLLYICLYKHIIKFFLPSNIGSYSLDVNMF
jgi:hypothetical protein